MKLDFVQGNMVATAENEKESLALMEFGFKHFKKEVVAAQIPIEAPPVAKKAAPKKRGRKSVYRSEKARKAAKSAYMKRWHQARKERNGGTPVAINKVD